MYKKCRSCSYISKFKKSDNIKCKKCGESDIYSFDDFPVLGAQQFLHQVDVTIHDLDDINTQIDLYNFEGFETTSLFLCATYEVLLENQIVDVLYSMNTNNNVIELLLNSNQGQDRMGKVLSGITGCGSSCREVFKAVDELDLYEKMQKIIKTRNKYIHGKSEAFRNSDVQETDLKDVSENIVKAFMKIHNKFVYKG